MSYKSRTDLRDEIDAGLHQPANPALHPRGIYRVPFTNGGVYLPEAAGERDHPLSGDSQDGCKRRMNRAGRAPHLNMTTINLFDEEIVWIVLSTAV